jgi:hypothetical protein
VITGLVMLSLSFMFKNLKKILHVDGEDVSNGGFAENGRSTMRLLRTCASRVFYSFLLESVCKDNGNILSSVPTCPRRQCRVFGIRTVLA